MAVQIRLGPDIRLLLFIIFSKIHFLYHAGISGLVVEYIVAIDVTRVRFLLRCVFFVLLFFSLVIWFSGSWIYWQLHSR